MHEISETDVIKKIKDEIIRLASHLPDDYSKRIKNARKKEPNERARRIMDRIIQNAEIAEKDAVPLCQDTGMVVMFVRVGRDAPYSFNLNEALQEAVGSAYKDGFLRKSIVSHPLNRKNTDDNTPAVIHYEYTEGQTITIRLALKGGGSENMSRMTMLSPSDGREGVIRFVLDTVKKAGGKTCPPIVVGVGIGGNFEKAPLMAKKALLRDLEDRSDNGEDRALEETLFKQINETDIGPMGLGGRTTCLSVKVESHPCHIASLPVAVNLQCHSYREGTVMFQ